MRTFDTALQTMHDSDVHSWATFFQITKNDGTILYLTDHDTDLVIDSITYVKTGGVEKAPFVFDTDGSIDNSEIHGLLEAGSITEAEVLSRRFDRAKIQIFRADHKNLPASLTSTSVFWLFTGFIGETNIKNNEWFMEVRSLKQALNQIVGERTSRFCRANLGDSRCNAPIASFDWTGTVSSVSGKTITTNIASFNDALMQNGRVSIASKGFAADIASTSGSVITLYDTVFDTDLVGESIYVLAGCDKTLETCRNVYNNVVNFVGEPHTPTADDWRAGENPVAINE